MNHDTVPLREYLELKVDGLRRETELRAALTTMALDKAAESVTVHLAGMNEWRGALTDQSRTMATRDELTALTKTVEQLRLANANKDGRQAVIALVVGFGVSLLTALIVKYMSP